MPEPQGSSATPAPGLFVSLRSFWSVLLAIFYTRLDLATTELEDQATRVVKMLVAGLVSVLCFHAALLFAMLFLLACVWDTAARLWVIGGIFAVFALLGVFGILLAKDLFSNRPKFLSHTIAELRRDVEGLNKLIPKKAEDNL